MPAHDAVQAIVVRAGEERPTLRFEPREFASHLERLLLSEGPGAPLDFARLHAGDLLLAFLCAKHDDDALRLLERDVLRLLDGTIRRVNTSVPPDDIKQDLRTTLLLETDDTAGPPRILAYRGEAPLLAWVRTIARRIALRALRLAPTTSPEGAEGVEDDLSVDPEVRLHQAAGLQDFRRRFERSAGLLSPTERSALHAYYLDGERLETIASRQGISRATAARRIESARVALRHSIAAPPEAAELEALADGLSARRILAASRRDD